MIPVLTIGWFLWLCFAVAICLEFIGWRGLTTMFPEGRRWWQLPVQLLTLAHFAAVVLCHPF